MLVLSRKTGETIRVGSKIELVVLGVNRGRVKLGFAGPREVLIRRGEHADAECRRPGTGIADSVDACTHSDGQARLPGGPLRYYRSASGV